jgi:hypothetical protein
MIYLIACYTTVGFNGTIKLVYKEKLIGTFKAVLDSVNFQINFESCTFPIGGVPFETPPLVLPCTD